ncbi:hypothetical protein HAX54_044763 [Datura stramonium]|uniref:Uncharacterized protein n=1 Tax=Datura stramonium TaxID=4076 RepID=A0ABS8WH77_DATST|nr:hypothetical protein [Datura stramonium]
MLQIGLLEKCMRVFLGYKDANQGLWNLHDENHGWNYEYLTGLRSQEREKSLHSKIESMLEMVLELVVSTDLGIRKLRDDLLKLTQIVKGHEISIKHLEERMYHLASQGNQG